jgi:hypothetical protein
MQKRTIELFSRYLLIGSLFGLFLLFNTPATLAQNNASEVASYYGGATVRSDTRTALGVLGQSEADPRVIIARVINVAMGFLGIIALCLILYAGYLWMTSGGAPDKIEKAKEILKNAAIGLLIILSAWAIVSFLFAMFWGGSGGSGGGGNQTNRGGGLGAFGNGIIESVYPEPNQTDVARNTSIIVTFREKIAFNSICATTSAALSCNGEFITSTTTANFDGPNVRIYQTAQAAACEKAKIGLASSTCNTYQAQVFSKDGKTFLFKTTKYLGSPSEALWHTVYLTNQLKKASNGESAFRAFDTVRDQSWSFQVSTKLDFDPPQIISGGVFPAPDLKQDDQVTTATGTQAQGLIAINGALNYEVLAASTGVTKNPPTMTMATPTVAVDPSCDKTSMTVIYASSSNADIFQIKVFQAGFAAATSGVGMLSPDKKTLSFAICNLTMTFTPRFDSRLVSTGNFWDIALSPYRAPDLVHIGNETYTASTSQDSKAYLFDATNARLSLMSVINDKSQLVVATTAGVLPTQIKLLSKEATKSANEIDLTSNNTAILTVTPFSGGQDLNKTTKVYSRPDKPMNTVIQINFSEAINPLTVAGSSTDVAKTLHVSLGDALGQATAPCSSNSDCKSYNCGLSGICVGDYLEGRFIVSNAYRTVEFISNHQCGTNGCGENIYCLPPKSHIKVDIIPANLTTCNSDDDCTATAPFSVCGNKLHLMDPASVMIPTCQASGTLPTNLPQASSTDLFEGVMDASFNSLDGNRNGNADGILTLIGNPSYYFEDSIYGMCSQSNVDGRSCMASTSDDSCGLTGKCSGAKPIVNAQEYGDIFSYSFYTNASVKTGAPAILANGLSHGINDTGVNLYNNIIINWNSVMLSSSITTGERQMGTSTVWHKFLNIGSFTGLPTGYWSKSDPIDNAPADGELESTNAEIAHADFDQSMKYWAQVGSGLRDIYQNCYKPSNGPGPISGSTCGVNDPNPSCCSGQATSTAATSSGIRAACKY